MQKGRNEGALEGIRFADFTWTLAGGMATKHFADYGATVVNIEWPKRGGLRTVQPFRDGKPGVNRSGYFNYYHTNTYSLTLELSHPKAVEIAKKLILWADIVAENFTPGTMEKWGLGYEDLRKIKPDIIMIRTSHLGQTGPFAKHPGLGNHLNALSGVVYLTGWPDLDPVALIVAYTDYFSGIFGTTALLAALDYRRRTGKGQLLDVSQLEAGLQFQLPSLVDYIVNERIQERMGNACPYAVPHGAYRCKGEERWCAIAVSTDQEWRAFCQVIGNPNWTRESRFSTLRGRKNNEEELNRLVEEWTINFTAEQVMSMMQAVGVAAGVVQNAEDLYNDPQLRYRNFFWVMDHLEIGSFSHQGEPSVLSKTPAQPRIPAACLGEHNEYVCREFLGISEEEFDALLISGMFGL